jgi:hypothetical protein
MADEEAEPAHLSPQIRSIRRRPARADEVRADQRRIESDFEKFRAEVLRDGREVCIVAISSFREHKSPSLK